MTTNPERVVFDWNVFFQALTSPAGPAARLLELASSRDILLFVSVYAIDEIRDVTSRPHIVAKYRLEATIVANFIADISSFATYVDSVPHVFDFGRHGRNAAVACVPLSGRIRLHLSARRSMEVGVCTGCRIR
jgi:PIN domain